MTVYRCCWTACLTCRLQQGRKRRALLAITLQVVCIAKQGFGAAMVIRSETGGGYLQSCC